jgi:hydroxymethylbilane synthase
MGKRIVRVGSRKSRLAMAQSKWVIEQVIKKHPDIEFQLVGIQTKGDIILDQRLDKIGGKGLFIKELENAILDGTIDIAVHSMKDMPADIPEGLEIAAVSKREDPRDVLVTGSGVRFNELPVGAVLGTSSARREVQVLLKRPDLRIKTLRGNVNTRLDKLTGNEYDAIMLAAAGLNRLGLGERCVQYFEVDDIIPAVGQGILGVETRKGENVDYLMDTIHSAESAVQIEAERAFLIRLNGGCTIPMAAHAVIEGRRIKVYGMLASDDGKVSVRDIVEGEKDSAAQLGRELADRLVRMLGRK